jgi:hypothetical protein
LAVLAQGSLRAFLEGTFTTPGLDSMIDEAGVELGFSGAPAEKVLRAIVACKAGFSPESVAPFLDWREFEAFCSRLFGAAGYRVTKDVRLRKPTAQIDLLAHGNSVVFSVDCKHWARSQSPSVLRKVALDQFRRSSLLRKKTVGLQPIVSVILSLSASEGSFVEGVAVVPLRALPSFLTTFDSYSDLIRVA